MDNKVEKGEDKKTRLKDWLRNKYNLYFLLIIIFAIILRLYYFYLTKNQALWWDEAEYMSIAKNWAFNVPYEISSQRLVLFPFLALIFYSLGLGELSIKFFLVLVPSIFVVIITYLFVKEMYNERIALLTAFITSVCWIHLFYSVRVMNDEIGFMFGLLAFWFFWKGYISNKNDKYVYLSGFFIGLSFLIRPTAVYYGAILLFFLLITEKLKFLKRKQLWIMALVFLLTLVPHMAWSYYYHGDPLAFRSAYGGPGTQDSSLINASKFMLQFIYDYPEKIFFFFFLLGLLTLVPLFLSLDKIFKGEKRYYNDLLMITSIIFIELFFIYFLRFGENRWLMAISLGIFIFASKGILLVYDYILKNINKTLAIMVLLLILISGAYFQLNHADQIIKARMDSYSQVKEAGLWIKENSNSNDVIFSRSWPQNTYYSERETFTFDMLYTTEKNLTDFNNLIIEKRPKYFVISIFEPHSPWLLNWPQNYSNAVNPVKVFTFNNQPALVIYEVDYSALKKDLNII